MSLSVPAHFLYFSLYETLKRRIEPGRGLQDKSLSTYFVAGLLAELGGSLLWVPSDIIKQRLQVVSVQGEAQLDVAVATRYYRGPAHVVQTIWKDEGFMGFYRGYIASVGTFAPFVGFHFLVYEWLRGLLRTHWYMVEGDSHKEFAMSLPVSVAAGGLASAVATFITSPIDIARMRLQIHDHAAGRLTMTGVWGDIIRADGFTGLFRGVVARIMWLAPGSAIIMGLYEHGKGYVL